MRCTSSASLDMTLFHSLDRVNTKTRAPAAEALCRVPHESARGAPTSTTIAYRPHIVRRAARGVQVPVAAVRQNQRDAPAVDAAS
jgi:hypothetical protein